MVFRVFVFVAYKNSKNSWTEIHPVIFSQVLDEELDLQGQTVPG